MSKNALLLYLANFIDEEITNDPLFSDVNLLLPLSANVYNKGKLFYSDFSKYQRHIRYYSSKQPLNKLYFLPGNFESNTDFPDITYPSNTNIHSFAYFANKYSIDARIGELNQNISNFDSTLSSTYLESVYYGSDIVDLGTNDWCIEFSLFTDRLNLPWKYSYVFGSGPVISKTKNFTSVDNVITGYDIENFFGYGYLGWGVYIKQTSLYLAVKGVSYLLTSITNNTWYNLAIQKHGNKLKIYNNGVKINEYTVATNYGIDLSNVSDPSSYLYRFRVANQGYTFRGTEWFTASVDDYLNTVDTAFSGGISYIRVTKALRYKTDNYKYLHALPFSLSSNKIDNYYNNVLSYYPMTTDMFDYSSQKAHVTNADAHAHINNLNCGYLPIDGKNIYYSNTISSTLNNQWTLEFYFGLTENNSISKYFNQSGSRSVYYSDQNFFESDRRVTYKSILDLYKVRQINPTFNIEIPFITLLTEDNKFIFRVSAHIINDKQTYYSVTGIYFSCKFSSDGVTWQTIDPYPYNWNQNVYYNPVLNLPTNELKFLKQNGRSNQSLPEDTTKFRFLDDDPCNHLAFAVYNNYLYVLFNGEVITSTSILNLYSGTGLKLQFGGIFDTIPAINPETNKSVTLSFGIFGVRLTNLCRYSLVEPNDYNYNNSRYPAPLGTNTLPPPRARIKAIAKTNTDYSILTDTCSWYVYLTCPVDNLSLDDFSFTQAEGLTGCSLLNLEKTNEFEYIVTASTGSNTGLLTLNFVDRHILCYKNSNIKISNFVGELSFTGETYRINKLDPTVILTSGSNPYVSGSFEVTATFNTTIETFDATKIGLVNASYKNVVKLSSSETPAYRFTVVPIKSGPVKVQLVKGAGITTNNKYSAPSNTLTRIYSDSFVTLQLPLNTSYPKQDLSPARLVLNEYIPNSGNYITTEFPLGETSCLHVIPTLEYGGLVYTNYNAVASTELLSQNSDWTIEFYLRINTNIGTKFAHIISLENANLGFCIVADNGKLRVQRTINNAVNLFPSITTFNDKATSAYIDWSNTNFTIQQKFPHFAITKQNNIYRFYINGIRVGLTTSDINIDITKGKLHIGYYPNRVNDVEYKLSNVRFTLGKALYTTYQINIPALPYPVPKNILDETELLNYVSIYSDNNNNYLATNGNRIYVKFASIITLSTIPSVTICNRSAFVNQIESNIYLAYITVSNATEVEGEATFQISIGDQVFTETTNNSKVYIDFTNPTVTINLLDNNTSNLYYFDIEIVFNKPVVNFSIDNLIITNGHAFNLHKYPNLSIYGCSIKAIQTGNVTVSIDSNVVVDFAGHGNLASNVVSKEVIVPSSIPDPNYNKVLLLIEPKLPNDPVQDLSSYSLPLEVNNVEVVTDTSPTGNDVALKFNGRDSYIKTTLPTKLLSNKEYTVELWMYSLSRQYITLNKPVLNLPFNITSNGFSLEWNPILNATSYVIDVSRTNNFNNYVKGYKHLNIGNNTTFTVSQDSEFFNPVFDSKFYVGNDGFALTYQYPIKDGHTVYQYDIAYDKLFDKKLSQFNNCLTKQSYIVIGDLLTSNTLHKDLVNLNQSSNLESSNLVPLLRGLIGDQNTNSGLVYVLDEDTVRFYKDFNYSSPLIAFDILPKKWYKITLINKKEDRFKSTYLNQYRTYLYIDNVLMDNQLSVEFPKEIQLGYAFGGFYGYLQGIRITYEVAREINLTLPYSLG